MHGDIKPDNLLMTASGAVTRTPANLLLPDFVASLCRLTNAKHAWLPCSSACSAHTLPRLLERTLPFCATVANTSAFCTSSERLWVRDAGRRNAEPQQRDARLSGPRDDGPQRPLQVTSLNIILPLCAAVGGVEIVVRSGIHPNWNGLLWKAD